MKIHGVNIAIIAHHHELCNELILTTFPAFEWLGYPAEAWLHDLKVRASVLSQHETITKLNTAKAKLENFLSEDDKLAITLKEIQTLL